MYKINVRFLSDGKWSDHPSEPIFEVKEGQTIAVSPSLAATAIEAGKAILLDKNALPMPSTDVELSDREADLVAREIALDDDELELMTAKEEFTEREKAVTEREQAVEAREKNVAKRKPGPKPKKADTDWAEPRMSLDEFKTLAITVVHSFFVYPDYLLVPILKRNLNLVLSLRSQEIQQHAAVKVIASF